MASRRLRHLGRDANRPSRAGRCRRRRPARTSWRWSGSALHEVRHRRFLGRRPQQREHLEHQRRRRTGPRPCSTNGRETSTTARPRSQVTITFLRSQRSTSTPPTGARKNPGTMPGAHHQADGRLRRAAARPGRRWTAMATSPSQSPSAETTWASHRRKNDGEPRSWRPADGLLVGHRRPSSSVVGSSPDGRARLRHGSSGYGRGRRRPGRWTLRPPSSSAPAGLASRAVFFGGRLAGAFFLVAFLAPVLLGRALGPPVLAAARPPARG